MLHVLPLMWGARGSASHHAASRRDLILNAAATFLGYVPTNHYFPKRLKTSDEKKHSKRHISTQRHEKKHVFMLLPLFAQERVQQQQSQPVKQAQHRTQGALMKVTA